MEELKRKKKEFCKTDVEDIKQIFTESKCHFLLQFIASNIYTAKIGNIVNFRNYHAIK